MNIINFSANWDKLKPENFISGKIFTTCRKYSKKKLSYYKSKRWYRFNVQLNKKTIGRAYLQYRIDIVKASDLTLDFIKKDTKQHYTREDFEKLMQRFYGEKNPPLILLWFETEEVIR